MLGKYRALREDHAAAVSATGRNPFGLAFDTVLSATEAMLDGRRVLLLGTNNYLGLTFDRDCMAAAVAATEAEGTGTTGSRIANGSYGGHEALERRLAAFLGRRERDGVHHRLPGESRRARRRWPGAATICCWTPTATPASTTARGSPARRSRASATTTPTTSGDGCACCRASRATS